MKSAWFGLCVCFVLLQGCSQQKAEQRGTVNQSTPPPAVGGKPAELTPEQIKRFPKSQQFFMQSKTALEQHKIQECFDLLGKAASAAKEEKNYSAAILCSETQARLKIAQKDKDGAATILETSVKDFDLPSLDAAGTMRLDGSRALLAGLYAINSKPDKAEALYKEYLKRAQEQKPVNHERIAFWMRNYAEFYKFQKNDKESQDMQKAAIVELSKAPHAVVPNAAPPAGAPEPQGSKK